MKLVPGSRTDQQGPTHQPLLKGFSRHVGGRGEMLASQPRQSPAPSSPNQDPTEGSQGSRSCDGCEVEGGRASSLTLGAVTRPKQGFLVLTVICGEGQEERSAMCRGANNTGPWTHSLKGTLRQPGASPGAPVGCSPALLHPAPCSLALPSAGLAPVWETGAGFVSANHPLCHVDTSCLAAQT